MATEQRSIIQSFTDRFTTQKQLAERAIVQLSDAQLHQSLDENTNSISVIMKHMSGNLRSRFTDFLTTDGDKPTRDRDSEFIDDIRDRASLLATWEEGWACLFQAISELSDADLGRTVTIRQQPHSVTDALIRSLDHLGYHTGQIVLLSRYLAKDKWQTLTIRRGGSVEFNEKMKNKNRAV